VNDTDQEAVVRNNLAAEDPLVVAHDRDVQWDDEADVVVVGFGGAGASAALEAHECGADVLVIERFKGGGSTAFSGGVYYAGGTQFQRDAGYEDTAKDMFDYLCLERKDAVSEDTLLRFCEQSAENTNWLVKHGVGFEGSLYTGKISYPPEGKHLYFSGNEKVPAFSAKARPAPRGHRTLGKGLTGYAFFGALKNSVMRSTIRVQNHSRAVRLVVDDSGAVIGVETLEITRLKDQKKHQKLYAIVVPTNSFNSANANQAIKESLAFERQVGVRKLIRVYGGLILATGGFSYNADMLRKHMPSLADRTDAMMRLGSMGCSGDGIRLGVSVGGAVRGLDRSYLGRQIAPPAALLQGLIVNRQGKRFINEDAYSGVVGEAIRQQPNGDAWMIIDKQLYRAMLMQCLPSGDGGFKNFKLPTLLNLFFGRTKRDPTLGGLASKIGVDPVGLKNSVASMHHEIEHGEPDPLGKNSDYRKLLGAGPYWALNTSISNRFAFFAFFTLGGLQLDEQSGSVLGDNGAVIKGLYAAGRAAIGIPSDIYLSGLSLADCVFSGRRAGRSAAVIGLSARE